MFAVGCAMLMCVLTEQAEVALCYEVRLMTYQPVEVVPASLLARVQKTASHHSTLQRSPHWMKLGQIYGKQQICSTHGSSVVR